MSDISQLHVASTVGEGGGMRGVGHYAPHIISLPGSGRGTGRGVAFSPLGWTRKFSYSYFRRKANLSLQKKITTTIDESFLELINTHRNFRQINFIKRRLYVRENVVFSYNFALMFAVSKKPFP
jgi:hypothetical protein